MGMPSINIVFIERAKTAMKRAERGVVGLILRDATVPSVNPLVLTSADDIEELEDAITQENRGELTRAMLGNVTPPTKVIAYFLAEKTGGPQEGEDQGQTEGTEDISALQETAEEGGTLQEALGYFETCKLNYMAVPIVQEHELETVAAWVQKERKNGRMVKAVLPNHAADSEAIINYATESVTAGEDTFTTAQFCGRMAGICAGTPLTQAITYAKLPEVTDCSRMTKKEMDQAVDDGKLLVFHDGETVKVARGVNSLQTTTEEKGKQFKKIKILDVMDAIKADITVCIQEYYIGKYTNSYDNKCLLMGSIAGYLDRLVKQQLLDFAQVEIDIAANKAYLESQKIDTWEMNEETIKRHPTDEKVFLIIRTKILDAMEDVSIQIEV